MFTETELRIRGIEALTSKLGAVEAERFISIILKEPFDYTKWQKSLWEQVSVKELSTKAMKSFNANK